MEYIDSSVIINNKEEILSQGLSLQEGLLIAADAP